MGIHFMTSKEKLARHKKRYKAYKQRKTVRKQKEQMAKEPSELGKYYFGLPLKKKKKQGKKLTRKAPIRLI